MAKTLDDHRKDCLKEDIIPYPVIVKNLFVRDLQSWNTG